MPEEFELVLRLFLGGLQLAWLLHLLESFVEAVSVCKDKFICLWNALFFIVVGLSRHRVKIMRLSLEHTLEYAGMLDEGKPYPEGGPLL